MTDIIIPVWNQSEITIRCLDALARETSGFRLIIIDNGSRPDERARVREAIERLKISATKIDFEANMGFSVAVNRGIRESSSDPVIVMNNDVVVSPRWLEKILRYVSRHPFSGVTGVLQDAGKISHYRKYHGDILFPFDEVNAKSESDRNIVASCVPFACVALRRPMIDQIGYLDEAFSPCLGEDDDYCDRARFAGWNTVLLLNVLIHHDHRTSVKMIRNYEEIAKRNRELYFMKYRARRRKK